MLNQKPLFVTQGLGFIVYFFNRKFKKVLWREKEKTKVGLKALTFLRFKAQNPNGTVAAM